ncbi:MAG: CHASE2 domain-containing protein [Steroidobacteraceae bacterium]
MFARPQLWLLAGLLAMTVAISLSNVLQRIDFTIYDALFLRGPAPSDVLIVAIDDKSIAEVGRWPWPRALHAVLLDRLRAAGVRSAALDLLLSEPESPQADAALAAAMAKGPPTVLPSFATAPSDGGSLAEQLPIPILARSAASIGHVELTIDPDGIVRSVLLMAGPGRPTRPYLAAALLMSTPGARPVQLEGERLPAGTPDPGAWVGDYRVLIPFLGPPGHFRQVSYVDVLRGRIPDSVLRGKIVLVGATAQGLEDALPTPVSASSRPMPGVEIVANVLQGLRTGTLIRPVGRIAGTLLALLPVLLAVIGLHRLPPRQSLVLVVALWIGTLGASMLALHAGWWWPPAAALAALIISYPLWSWLRLEATQAFLDEQLAELSRERFPLLNEPRTGAGRAGWGDFMQRRIDLAREAAERLRSARRLISDAVNGLPASIILADNDGRIVLVNPAAASLFAAADPATLESAEVDTTLAGAGADGFDFESVADRAPCSQEILLRPTGRNLLLRAAPFHDGTQHRIGTLLALTDITELRATQREREDVVRFLSHDMKSPATSLLGLAELQRDPERALPPPELSQRLDVLAQRMLMLLDSFIALARAESADPTSFEEFDLRDAVQDACDEVWAAAQARNVTIRMTLHDHPCVVNGDRLLLARAIINLLGNAIKFSSRGEIVALSCTAGDRCYRVSVADRGPGVAAQSWSRLFERFSRGVHARDNDPGGAGLGLAFVRVVAEKHGGRAWAEPNTEVGAVFALAIPVNDASSGRPLITR